MDEQINQTKPKYTYPSNSGSVVLNPALWQSLGFAHGMLLAVLYVFTWQPPKWKWHI